MDLGFGDMWESFEEQVREEIMIEKPKRSEKSEMSMCVAMLGRVTNCCQIKQVIFAHLLVDGEIPLPLAHKW